MQKERWADWSVCMSVKSDAFSRSVACLLFSVTTAGKAVVQVANTCAASACSAGVVLTNSLSNAFSRSTSVTCCWRLSKKNFFRSLVLRAKMRFLSLLRSIWAWVFALAGAESAFLGFRRRLGAGAAAPAAVASQVVVTLEALTVLYRASSRHLSLQQVAGPRHQLPRRCRRTCCHVRHRWWRARRLLKPRRRRAVSGDPRCRRTGLLLRLREALRDLAWAATSS